MSTKKGGVNVFPRPIYFLAYYYGESDQPFLDSLIGEERLGSFVPYFLRKGPNISHIQFSSSFSNGRGGHLAPLL